MVVCMIIYATTPYKKYTAPPLALSCSNFPAPPAIYPRHWKLNQRIPLQPQTLGEQIKKHRLELHWLQTDVAARIGISSASVSNWERGVTSPSCRMIKKIREFLSYTPPVLVPRKRSLGSYCWECEISETSPERCLFERFCKRFNQSSMQSQVHATDPNKVGRWRVKSGSGRMVLETA